MPIVIRHNSVANSLAEGFAEGSEGLARGLRWNQARADELAQHKERIRLADEEVKLRQAASAREQERLDILKSQRVAAGEAASGLAQIAMADQTYGPQSDPDEEYARAMVGKLKDYPEAAQLFLGEYRKHKTDKMLLDQKERHLSAFADLAKDPGVAPFMDEEMQTRIANATETLGMAESPEQLAEVLPVSKKAIDSIREDLATRHARQQEVAQVGGFYEQQLAADMQAAMLERNPAIKAWKLNQIDQQRKYLGAFLTSKPGTVKTSEFLTRMSALDQDVPMGLMQPRGQGSGGGRVEVPDFIPKPASQEAALSAAAKVLGGPNGDKAYTTEQLLAEAVKITAAAPKRGSSAPDFVSEAPDAKADLRSQVRDLLKSNGIDPDAKAPEKPKEITPAKTAPLNVDEYLQSAKLYEEVWKKGSGRSKPREKELK